MGILKSIRPLKINGEILRPGEMFRTSNVQLLLDRRYARTLNENEVGDILDDFVREAFKVLGVQEKTEVEAETKQEVYFCCHGSDFWTSKHGAKICRECHPPVVGAEI